MIPGNPVEEVHSTMDDLGGSAKVSLLQKRAGMGERMHLDGQSFLQPRLGLRVVGLEGIG